MTLAEAKSKFRNEWIAFRISKEEDKENPEGKVVLHHKHRMKFNKELVKEKIIDVYVTYTGPVVKEGYAVILSTR